MGMKLILRNTGTEVLAALPLHLQAIAKKLGHRLGREDGCISVTDAFHAKYYRERYADIASGQELEELFIVLDRIRRSSWVQRANDVAAEAGFMTLRVMGAVASFVLDHNSWL